MTKNRYFGTIALHYYTLRLARNTGPDELRHALTSLGNYYACMIDPKKKAAIIKKFQTHAGDTGSSEVQIAILTSEIDELIGHLKMHPKDHSSRRGLLRKVSSRRSLMRFLKKEDPASYEVLTKKLKIKQSRVIAKPGAKEVLDVEALEDEGEAGEKDNEIVNE